MIAEVEQPDGNFVDEERKPDWFLDFCDRCGVSLVRQLDEHCLSGHKKHRWVIYLSDDRGL